MKSPAHDTFGLVADRAASGVVKSLAQFGGTVPCRGVYVGTGEWRCAAGGKADLIADRSNGAGEWEAVGGVLPLKKADASAAKEADACGGCERNTWRTRDAVSLGCADTKWQATYLPRRSSSAGMELVLGDTRMSTTPVHGSYSAGLLARVPCPRRTALTGLAADSSAHNPLHLSKPIATLKVKCHLGVVE